MIVLYLIVTLLATILIIIGVKDAVETIYGYYHPFIFTGFFTLYIVYNECQKVESKIKEFFKK